MTENTQMNNLMTPVDMVNPNNWAILSGDLDSEVELSHRVGNCSYYTFKLRIKRLSGNSDIIPVTMPENVLNDMIATGFSRHIYLEAQLRSYNEEDENRKNHVRVFAYATAARFVQDNEFEENKYPYMNYVFIRSYICKLPNYRITPTNKRITDLMLVINRIYNKADYIPAIAWGSDADLCADINTRTLIEIVGRFQSREYIKTINESENKVGVSYEVSISHVAILDNHNEY